MRTLKRQNDSKKIDKIKNNFFVFDTETTKLEPLKKNFVFCVLYGYNFYKVFKTQKDFLKEIAKPKYKKKYIFAHNAEFDLTVIFGNIYKNCDNSAIFNGRFISANYNGVTFADSLNIYEASVKKIGEITGLKKLENEKVKTEGLTKKNITPEDIEYCIRDCQIIFDALLKIFEYVGCIKLTLSSLSLYNFRNKYLTENIVFSELVDEFYNSYYGGRTEVFKVGKCEAEVFDINSLYPDVMRNTVFPDVRNLKKETKIDVKYLLYCIKYYEGCAKVTIEHKENYFGFLPYKDEKLLFPVGTFTGVWNFNELRFCMANNVINILHCDYIVYGNPVQSPFIKFVDEHYNKRINATNELDAWIEKYTLNKLYGRFAMRMKYQTTYYEQIPYDLINELELTEKYHILKTFSELRPDCFLITQNEKFKNSFFSIPAWSSYITSEARIKLLKALIQNKDSVLYCDTDSLFCSSGFVGDVGKGLGQFKKEDKKVLEICGLKNYVYKDLKTGEIKESIKGVNRNAEKLSPGRYKIKKYFKTKESLRRNTEAGKSFEMIKELKHIYDKRVVNKSNGTTKPIKL